VETNIDDEIATLRAQITTTEQEIEARKGDAAPNAAKDAPPAEDAKLTELVEAHASMLTRLSP